MIFAFLLLLVPLALSLAYLFHAPPLWVFLCGVGAIAPLAEWIRRATEQVARRAGPGIGGLLNVTFGNAAELILALFVLMKGQPDVVKGQITGSIIGNSLLGLGLAILVGSIGRERQTFKRERAGLLTSLLILATIALLVPALFDYTERRLVASPARGHLDEWLSLGVSVVLILVYAADLFYVLRTHRSVFRPREADEEQTDENRGEPWSWAKSIGVLLAATAATAWMGELVSGALDAAAGQLHVSAFFLGVVVLAVIGNAAEYVAAVYYARRDRMGGALSILVGSSIQVALLVAPVLVIVSNLIGRPMTLVFSNPLELIAVGSVAFAVSSIARDGETTWFEGVLLIAVYVILAFAFLFATQRPA